MSSVSALSFIRLTIIYLVLIFELLQWIAKCFDLYRFLLSEVTLMDANYTLDEELGKDSFIVNTLTNDVALKHVFNFPNGSKVHTTLFLTKK